MVGHRVESRERESEQKKIKGHTIPQSHYRERGVQRGGGRSGSDVFFPAKNLRNVPREVVSLCLGARI